MRVGLLLPHFGPFTDWSRLFDVGASLAERGFASAWVRDQLGFRGGLPFEPRSSHFVDPIVTLAALAARSDITIGTATLVPIRPPVMTAQLIGSLAYLARGHFILGIGLGGVPPAFELAGRQWEDRHDLFRETVEVVRALAHPGASYDGRFARFTNLTVDPAPPEDLEIWFSGTSRAAIRLTLEYATGWFPGRIPLRVFDRLLAGLREGEVALGRAFRVGIMPLVSLDRDRATAPAKVNPKGLLDEARSKKAWRVDGPFDSADDLHGMLLAGSTDDIVADLQAFAERGIDEVVLDLRQRMDAYEATLALLAAEVIPVLRSV
jgi:alkanesulfonate monooxygenase SsuD/methylene tetrahydromethanopterin reductase-like flavin-dependent oxidoreductase (luciferase family)